MADMKNILETNRKSLTAEVCKSLETVSIPAFFQHADLLFYFVTDLIYLSVHNIMSVTFYY